MEIGRFDIGHEVLVLSSYQYSPRDGHLQQILHTFAFLKKNPKLMLYFDPIPAVMIQDCLQVALQNIFAINIEVPMSNFVLMLQKQEEEHSRLLHFLMHPMHIIRRQDNLIQGISYSLIVPQ